MFGSIKYDKLGKTSFVCLLCECKWEIHPALEPSILVISSDMSFSYRLLDVRPAVESKRQNSSLWVKMWSFSLGMPKAKMEEEKTDVQRWRGIH